MTHQLPEGRGEWVCVWGKRTVEMHCQSDELL